LALPCPTPPFFCTNSAIKPANEGDAADVPEITQYDPSSLMM
jgi:hypothetical protein